MTHPDQAPPRAEPAAPRGRLRAAASATGRGVRASGTAAGRAASYTFALTRRASHAEGAGESGLYRVIELHAFNAAGDAAVAISLAGTLFFQVPTDQARGQVALFLALTMLPFTIVAPLIGPFLDRFSHGRRWAIGATMSIRAFLCWLLADLVASGDDVGIFPAALGVLVASKAYSVTRATAVPRLVPPDLSLVKANSRISLAGVIGAAISAPLAVLASTAGSEWSLRYGFLVFVAGTILAILLPAQVDNARGEERSGVSVAGAKLTPPREVVLGLRCNSGLRLLSGLLTMFLAFLLRDHPLPGFEDRFELQLGLVIGATGLGNTLGIALGSLLRAVRPTLTVVLALVADALAATLAAIHFSLLTAIVLGLTVGLAQSLGKLSLDALIQQHVPEHRRASAFARSETLLQLSWVIGGLIGIALPLEPALGFGLAAAVLGAVLTWVLVGARRDQKAEAERGGRSRRAG